MAVQGAAGDRLGQWDPVNTELLFSVTVSEVDLCPRVNEQRQVFAPVASSKQVY